MSGTRPKPCIGADTPCRAHALTTDPTSRCPQCRRRHEQDKPRDPTRSRARDARRPTRYQRGYGTSHRRLRARLAPLVARGTVNCRRCGDVIRAGEPWDLGHDDHDRTRYRGPEHARCNRSAARQTRSAAKRQVKAFF